MDLVDPGIGTGRHGETEVYTPQQIRLLRRFLAFMRRGGPDLLKAMEVLLGEIAGRQD